MTVRMEAVLAVIRPYDARLLLGGSPPDLEAVPAAAFLTGDTLESTVRRYAENLGGGDLRAAASVWNKHYNAALLSGILAAMTLAGVGLDGSLGNVSITLAANGLPRAAVVHSLQGVVVYRPRLQVAVEAPAVSLGELHHRVLSALFAGHLAQIIGQIQRVTRLPQSNLWGNAGNLCADLYEKLAATPEGLAAAREDRGVLLDAPESPAMPGANPLAGSVRYEDLSVWGLPSAIRVRRTCCQRYRLPGMAHCYTCPGLSSEERSDLLRTLTEK